MRIFCVGFGEKVLMEDLSVISCYNSLKLYSYKIKNQQKQQFLNVQRERKKNICASFFLLENYRVILFSLLEVLLPTPFSNFFLMNTSSHTPPRPASQVVLVAHPLLEHLSCGQQIHWQNLEQHIFVRLRQDELLQNEIVCELLTPI